MGAQQDVTLSPVVMRRLQAMLDFVERIGQWYEQMSRLSRTQMSTVMKLGGGIVRLLDRGKETKGAPEE